MFLFDGLKAELTKLRDEFEPFIDKCCKFVECASPVASTVGAITGNPEITVAANAANDIATATDKAITDHIAAGSTASSATVAVASIAASVAASGLLSPEQSATINAAVSTIDPTILQALQQG